METQRKFRMHDGKIGSAITVQIVPKASQNEIEEVLNDGTVKIRLTSVNAGEAANALLIELLSTVLRVAKSQIEIVAGEKQKDKLITIANTDPSEVQERIITHLA